MGKKDFIENTIITIATLIAILLGQWVGSGISPINAIPGMIVMFIGVMLIVIYRTWFPKTKFPSFAMALLLGLIFAIPINPLSGIVLKYTDSVVFLATTTPILAVAGFSMGNSLLKLKNLGWKMFVVSIVVFVSTYFLSAVIAQIVLKIQGVI